MKKPIIAGLILVVLILLVAGIFFFFTGLKIEGNVIDSVEKKPVVSATIKINGKIDHTDKDGYFKAYMPIYPPVSIGVEKNGYKKFYQNLDNQWFFSSKKYEILLEPLTYQSILDSSRKELSSYNTYSFRYSWFFRIGEKDENLADSNADVSVLHNPYVILCELVGDHYHNDIIYLCKITKENVQIKRDAKESEAIGFFGWKELDEIKLFPNFKELLKKVMHQIT